MELTINVDGGARGNPGPAGAGVVIRDANGKVVHEGAYYLGHQTNNYAEYVALIRGLERAERLGPTGVTVLSDSELLVRQMTGDYQVKSANLQPLHRQAQTLLLRLRRWSIKHVRREQNRRADELANLAMDEQRDVVVADIEGAPPISAPEPRAADAQPSSDPASGPRFRHGPSSTDPRRGDDASTIRVEIACASAPSAAICPTAAQQRETRVAGVTLPNGLCTFAAHAILPTLVAMLNTDPNEQRGVPTLTVRCSKPGCGATFNLSLSTAAQNGHG